MRSHSAAPVVVLALALATGGCEAWHKANAGAYGGFFGDRHRYIGEDRTANALATTSWVGMGLAVAGFCGGAQKPIGHEPEWAEPVVFAGGVLILGSLLYDTFHTPTVAERNRKLRTFIGPQGAALSYRF